MRSRTITALPTAAAVTAAVFAVALIIVAAPAGGRPYLPPRGEIFAGLSGGSSIVPFQKLSGKHPPVFETFMTWKTPTAWLGRPDSGFRSRLALHIGTAAGYGEAGVISPEQIALGGSDRFLLALNRNLAHSGRIVYVRLMAEMNGYWNAYAAFDKNGAFRGSQNAPSAYVAAWRRTVLILRGGRVRAIDARLRRLHLPRLGLAQRHVQALARPKLAFLWVAQDAGSPEIAANSPAAYWPGGAYVDWVGTDFYASYPNFALLDSFYGEFPGKPFVLSEWALYGADDPGFVNTLFAWVRSHPRVRMLNYYQGFTASSLANLSHYPASRAALARQLRSRRFPAYPPEYAHPRRHRHGKPAKPPAPPQPPVVGVPPNPPGSSSQLCVTLLQVCLGGL